MNYTYWVEKIADNRYCLRQSRFKEQYLSGNEHPHDLMAQCFDKKGMLEIIEKYFPNTDTSAL
jgi:hypothetical protein